jgi:prevent-host-death family protein
MRTMTASYFRTHCCRVMRLVNATGEPVVLTKRGKPVAMLTQPDANDTRASSEKDSKT